MAMTARTLLITLAIAAHIFLVSTSEDCTDGDCSTDPVCDDGEVLDNCPVDSPADNCPKSEADNQVNPAPNPCPDPECKCGFNRRRAANGTCILTRDCPAFPCKRCNEEYMACPPICPTDACGLSRATGICPFRIGIILECNPRCQCKDGYGRYNGKCIPLGKCPNFCPENQEYSSCIQGVGRAQNCTDRNKPVPLYKIDSKSCKRGCVCKKNYYKNANGTCVTSDQCDDEKCPNPNEEYTVSMIPKCPVLDTCLSFISDIICNEPKVPGCTCINGYLRRNVTSPCAPVCECDELKNTPACKVHP